MTNGIDFEGQHAVVTGGAQGFGRAITDRLVRSNATVDVWDLKPPLDEHPLIHFTRVDVKSEEAVAAAYADCIRRRSRIDILINNAGIVGHVAPLWEQTLDQWRDVFSVNVEGAFLCSRAVIPGMRQARWGRIVNISSVAGKEGNVLVAPYSASKAALIGMTKTLGRELALDGVLVNCITAAIALTGVLDTMPDAERIAAEQTLLAKIPMGRFLEVEEVAALVAWLSSSECSFSTGAVFDITGGRSTY